MKQVTIQGIVKATHFVANKAPKSNGASDDQTAPI